jgi:beta-lactamase regulating signal transducer with metallopeptidase domain/DUF4097 and DUF4098 domain-containing protein YvlB
MMIEPIPLLLVKVTLVLIAGTALAAVLRTATAAARHLVWITTLASVAAIAALTPVVPALVLEVATVRPPLREPASLPLATNLVTTATAPIALTTPVIGALPAPPSRLHRWETLASAQLLPLAIIAWATIALLLLLRLVAGHVLVFRLTRRARRVPDVAAHHRLQQIAATLGVTRHVALVRSGELAAPITMGSRHPLIVVPGDCDDWTHERWRVVLTHECAHIARHDFVSQLLASVVTSLLWFHPAAWYAATRLRAEGEQAADDCVLASGVTDVRYAEHLLALARRHPVATIRPDCAVAMARPLHLESRLHAMFDSTRARGTMSHRRRTLTLAIAVLAWIPLAGLRTRAAAIAVPQRRNDRIEATQGNRPDSVVEHTLSARSGGTLVVDLQTGGGLAVHRGDDDVIRVRATLAGPNWRETEVTLRDDHGVATLRSEFSRQLTRSSTAHQFDVWVPRQFNLRIASAGGGLEISGLDGVMTGHTGGGEVNIDHTSGRVTLTTGGGDVSVADSHLDGEISTGGGHVSIERNQGNLRGHSGSESAMAYDGGRDSEGSSTSRRDRNAAASDMAADARDRATRAMEQAHRVMRSDETTTGTANGQDRAVGDIEAQLRQAEEQVRQAQRAARASGASDAVMRRLDDALQQVTRARESAVPASRIQRRIDSTVDMALDRSMRATRQDADAYRIDSDRPVTGSGRIMIQKDGGGIEIRSAPQGGVVSTGGGDIDIAASGGKLSVRTGGGRVSLDRVSGDASVWTGAGAISIEVVNTDGTVHNVDAWSGTGAVTLVLPRDLDARVQVETSYTESLGHRTNINSALKLEQSETSEWDSSQGTPRKYVRGSASFGNGRGLIRVTTVNGDITIKRS